MAAVPSTNGGKYTLKVWRADAKVPGSGGFVEYEVETYPGMVVLDAIHDIQAKQEPDLAVRWNCKAGRCGSCSAEINGKPKLLCMTRMSNFDPAAPIVVTPMKTWPLIKDLVTDVSHNYRVAKKIPPFKPRPRDADGHWRMQQEDIDRIQEFRKCIECFLCQDVCHVLRDHHKTEEFAGPRFLIHLATLDMHPLDTVDRRPMIKEEFGVGYCNITRCCTEVCPEHIVITDNGIIPLKERVADDFFDPLRWALRKIFPPKHKKHLPVLRNDQLPSAKARDAETNTAKNESTRGAAE
ncbi:MAG: succinate dehydrogenase/fumarate reductase iron-sulfur subunit [Myxococcales bacterium 68-20]|nr:succinate dehydrogenase/fumarate reductase iron-sulfur subunit [Myxococcales bacterium]OJY16466.1 MAG: succinate dehydrogenase/fumarate reductase iron-sulfur subunit [Myxococcales bacterium 68-20]